MKIKTENKMVTIKLYENEIEMLNRMLKYDKEILELVAKKEQLLELDKYPLMSLLRELKRELS